MLCCAVLGTLSCAVLRWACQQTAACVFGVPTAARVHACCSRAQQACCLGVLSLLKLPGTSSHLQVNLVNADLLANKRGLLVLLLQYYLPNNPDQTILQVNLVNADLLAKKRGLRIVETVVPSDGAGVLDEIEVRCACCACCAVCRMPACRGACALPWLCLLWALTTRRVLTPLLAAPLPRTPGGHRLQ